MAKPKRDSRGFTLIAALLLTLVLSALAMGLFYLVNDEQHMGSNDLEGNLAYYGAESGMENLTAQLSTLYQSSPSPTASALCALVTPGTEVNPTNVSGSNITSMNYTESLGWTSGTSTVTCPTSSAPSSSWDVVGAGPDQGMVATIIPYTLQVTATRLAGAGEVTNNTGLSNVTGASVNLTRTMEVALLPAFEFGIFCAYDCDYFAGPPFNFGGRVHVNGNLFLGSQSTLTFTDKVAAAGQVILDQLENGNSTSTYGYNDPVYIPTAAGGCPAAPGAGPATYCKALTAGSWTGGFPPTGTANTSTWKGLSTTTFNGFVINGATGATTLQLPFVQSSAVGPIDIIRKPTAGDSSLLSSSRLYNLATIRILLADTEGDLYPGETRSDSSTEDIQLVSGGYTDVTTVTGGTVGNMYYAVATKGTGNWLTAGPPTGCGGTTWPLHGEVTVSGSLCQGAWLRVEYLNSTQQWVGVTKEWLGFGFGRLYDAVPTHPYNSSTTTAPYCVNVTTTALTPGQCQNGISPAILILQQLQSGKAASAATGTITTDGNWIPINFYDAREGEPRDTRPSGDTGVDCSPNGIMNGVELDAGNLWLWLQGVAPYTSGSGTKVSITNQYGTLQNGYILYFADHRGMLPDAYPLTTFHNGISGMSGINDVVNSENSNGLPDGKLEPMTYYASATPTPYSPEDPAVKGATVNHGNVETWGTTYLGAGFGLSGTAENQPYYIKGTTSNGVQCYSSSAGTQTAEWNMVTGPRHVLRLVDGGMSTGAVSYLPPTNGNTSTNGGGFTVASEEPVYVLGNYNTGSADPFWPSENTTTTPHSAAAIIADTVTLLSNPPISSVTSGWYDQESFLYPATQSSRPGNTSYYRMAIASGKSIPWPYPSSWATSDDVGTDGGMHNFLRYLENRGANSSTVNYAGSMISMYYSQYNTGMFKCCNAVYGAPQRNYFFDTQFLNPNNLPPGTPMFQDVVSLSSHQNFTPQ
jgi:Tfp pilus assembly protein PilX